MITLVKGTISFMIVTVSEKQTLTSPYFLFVFKQRGSNEVKTFLTNTDLSAYPYRYNKFQITVNSFFISSACGFWDYDIYEQTSPSNTDPALAGKNLEQGVMQLVNGTDFTNTKYTGQDNTYKVYNG